MSEKIEEVTSDKTFSRIIGGFRTYELTYNVNDVSKDTVPFEILLLGNRRRLKLNFQSIESSGQILMIDSLILD